MTAWRTEVTARIGQLRAYLQEVDPSPGSGTTLDTVRERLETLESEVGGPGHWPGVGKILTGPKQQDAWLLLHGCEEDINDADVDVDRLVSRARDHLLWNFPPSRRREWERNLQSISPVQKAEHARSLIRESHQASAQRHSSQGNWRRGISTISLVLFAGVPIIITAQHYSKEPFIPAPDGVEIGPLALLVSVMLFGAVGGLLSGLNSLYLGKSPVDNTRWFDPKPGLAIAKVAFGIWAAFIGVLAVSTGLIVGRYTSVAAALLLALVFGYSQQAVTSMIDRKADEMLSQPEDDSER